MLTLLTANPAKYAPFASRLERWRIVLESPRQALFELQSLDFGQALAAKARAAAAMCGRPVLVDDAGLVLEACRPFPGPLTASVLSCLGPAGLERLVAGVSHRAWMECHLGCWVNGALRRWSGAVQGRLDFSRRPRDPRMMLSDLFVPDAGAADPGELPHRARALDALATDIFDLHLEAEPVPETGADGASALGTPHSALGTPHSDCPFCAEFEADGLSVFAQMMGDRLANRIVYEDEHFVVMPPLGQFIEGGLLLLTRQHILSLARLPPALFERLEGLLGAIRRAVIEQWGVPPLVFEHGPAPQRGKGLCCVDHAHFNIFPARLHVHPRLAHRMHTRLGSLSELMRLRRAEFGYLFVQENDGARHAYDGQDVPTQLVRRIISAELGLPERWHWRDYPGLNELIATCKALKGQIRL
ncbi:MAG: non-canonical purine NTP pyrophosphatase [Verrucomicrobiota bacterium]|jgi:XTP/dITP diphosphohydrolase